MVFEIGTYLIYPVIPPSDPRIVVATVIQCKALHAKQVISFQHHEAQLMKKPYLTDNHLSFSGVNLRL
jgi:hypothetical protein